MFRGGRHSHMSVDIDCLSLDPLFYANHTPNDPFFLQSTPNGPFCNKFYIQNYKFLCALHAFCEIWKFCGNFNMKLVNYGLKLQVYTLHNPHFRSQHQKRPFKFFFFFFFFWARTEWRPFFNKILHENAPYFRSPVGTCMSLSYSSAPTGCVVMCAGAKMVGGNMTF